MKNINSLNRGITIAAFFAFSFIQAQNYESVVKNYISTNQKYKKITASEIKITNSDRSESLKGTVVNVQQTYDGIPVFNAISSALIRDNAVSHFSDNFSDLSSVTVSSKREGISSNAAFDSVLKNLKLKNSPKYTFESGKENSILSKTVYFKKDNQLVLAYEINFEEADSSNYWNVLVNASNGDILERNNLLVSCKFDKHSYTSPERIASLKLEQNADQPKASNGILAPDNASYRVFELPLEAPTFGNRSLVSNPWLLDASPEGWHSDGTTHYTYTRGNNAYAYTDYTNTNVVGDVAEGGSTRLFDFPLDVNTPPAQYTNAAITQLFYMNNKMHDIFYKYGFTESARNFQMNNFGKGGAGNDYVRAEARDGGGTDNANFSTPADGGVPRMQMYLWGPKSQNFLSYNAPSELVGRNPVVGINTDFGPDISTNPVTADVVLVSPIKGCTTLSNTNLSGKIALIERGECNFTVKFKSAQDKGALGVIVYNAADSPAVGNMGGTDDTVTIPGVLVENTEGELIKSKLNTTAVNANIKDESIWIDGSLDNGIVAHEYGHGISNRNTGNGYSCLSTSSDNEQMGEGWSDFFALMLTNRPGDNASIPRGIGTFAINEPIEGTGIRPAQYSLDPEINAYTYGNTNGMTYVSNGVTAVNVHSVGFIWATMLWDLHWKMVEKYGYASDVIAAPDSGSGRVLQLVMNGLKLQGCSPTFVKGRNAIIAADLAMTGGADKCMIWNVFAKRGLGVNAASGSIIGTGAGMNDQVEDFTVPAECNLAVADVQKDQFVVYPNPAKNEIHIKSGSATLGKTMVKIYDASGKLVLEDHLNLSDNSTVNVASLPNGIYVVKGTGLAVDFSEKVIIKK
ncbi:T9SS-dependent M36 family metallopeptidase [Epilithonimonas tenax]|uniref:T9SS-dependent M36 family metallopeptidase n=1 Tax=Epilithonimonas tenax TaxID=191577 RepID=UPI000415F932|nr:T9SS-dependent M36 family metallopeptidase [Epilithonimonas tenax]